MPARYHPVAVRYRLARPRHLSLWLSLSLLVVALPLAAWVWQARGSAGDGLPRACAAALMLAPAAWGLWRLRQRWPRGWLAWDGGAWQWLEAELSDAGPGSVTLRLGWDGGSWLWLRVEPVRRGDSLAQRCLHWLRGQERWLLLREQDSPVLWGDLRRAVYFPATLEDW